MKTAIAGVLAIVALIGCGLGYRLYQQHHLSSSFKRTVTAAMDPTDTAADILVYLRDARLQTESPKDAEMLAKFQMMVRLSTDASDMSNRLWTETMQSLRAATLRETHPAFSQEIHDAEEKLAQKEAKDAKQLYREIRAELGLPSLPDTAAISSGEVR